MSVTLDAAPPAAIDNELIAPASAPEPAKPRRQPPRIRAAEVEQEPSAASDAYEALQKAEASEKELTQTRARIKELNTENSNRRRDNDALTARLNTADQRIIRAEAKDALVAAGAINSRIVDLFLADISEKAKIDPKTGEAIGIHDNLESWKAANADFFKIADAGTPPAVVVAAKPNATTTGAATVGGTAVEKIKSALPDLRNMPRNERIAAIRDYKKSLPRVRG